MIAAIDFGYPVGFLRGLRRELADKMNNPNNSPTAEEIAALAATHLAIAALEAVIAERREGGPAERNAPP